MSAPPPGWKPTCAPAALDWSAPKHYATRPGPRLRTRPDAENVCPECFILHLPPRHSIASSSRASTGGLPPLALSGALLVRRDRGDASMHRVHDLAPRLSIKPIGELVQPLMQ